MERWAAGEENRKLTLQNDGEQSTTTHTNLDIRQQYPSTTSWEQHLKDQR